MDVDHTAEALRILEEGQATYEITLGGKSYPLYDVRILNTTTPVRGSASRGNVYTESRNSYRMEAGVNHTVCGQLSQTMLGPSNRFGGLHISARTPSRHIDIEGSLLSMSRTGGVVRMNIAIVGV